MSVHIRTELEASRELEEAAMWYDAKRTGLGSEFLQAVDVAIDQVVRWPRLGRPVPGVSPDVPVRMMAIPRFPYRIAYVEMSGVIAILAFAHERREPTYWHHRVSDRPARS